MFRNKERENGGQQHEDKRLHNSHKYFQKVKGKRKQP